MSQYKDNKVAAIIISSSLVTLEMEGQVKHIALWDTWFHVYLYILALVVVICALHMLKICMLVAVCRLYSTL